MTHYDHQSPATVSTYPQLPPSSGSYIVGAPPPIGYPTQHNSTHASTAVPVPVETKSRGDGFWKGCCAALCCCCVLDACF
ncbi:Protein CYSTEINE-RICH TRANSMEMBRANE MODULE 6 [Linum perenne]